MRNSLKAILLLSLMFSSAVQAKEVYIEYNGLHLLANLEMAPGKNIKDGIVLMTHGTLGHGRMEIMSSLQNILKESGINSVAITLSYNVDQRHGLYDCNAQVNTHKHSDAVSEIGLWVNWLKDKGADNITLLGHSRGGNQTAWYASQHHDPVIKHVVLIAPGFWTAKSQQQEYQHAFNKNLKGVLKKAQALVKAGKGDTVMTADFIYCKDAKVTADSFVSYYGDNPDFYTPSLIKKIPVPVLIIAGSEDTTRPGVAKEYANSLKKGDKIHTIEGADHFFRDLYAYDIVDQITAFLGQ